MLSTQIFGHLTQIRSALTNPLDRRPSVSNASEVALLRSSCLRARRKPSSSCSLSRQGHPQHRLRRSITPAALQGICFDKACQDAQDQIFLTVVAVPLLCLVAVILYTVLRSKPEDESVFEDPQTGAVLQSTDGSMPERDQKGELAFRPVSYTPWPVEQDYEGERVRIRVGSITARQPRTFVFSKVLRQPSAIIQTTLPRPLGIIFEEDARRKRAVISGFMDGSPAAQLVQRVKLDRSQAGSAPAVGDVLRACTCTTFVFPTNSLFGAKPPQRHIVCYGADQQKWTQVMNALRRGDRSDGEVTLILEWQLPRED